jgi:hypothetical protein
MDKPLDPTRFLPATDTETVAAWYRLDADDRLVAVDPAWDNFARANEGGAACAALVLGRPLRDFLSGDATRMFLESALQAARLTGRARTLPYRCDAPGRQRELEMVITPQPDGGALVEHRLLATRERPPTARFRTTSAAAPADAGPLGHWRRCSQCLRVQGPGPDRAWHGAARWARTEPAAAAGRSVPVVDTVCHDCTVMARGHLADPPAPTGSPGSA